MRYCLNVENVDLSSKEGDTVAGCMYRKLDSLGKIEGRHLLIGIIKYLGEYKERAGKMEQIR